MVHSASEFRSLMKILNRRPMNSECSAHHFLLERCQMTITTLWVYRFSQFPAQSHLLVQLSNESSAGDHVKSLSEVCYCMHVVHSCAERRLKSKLAAHNSGDIQKATKKDSKAFQIILSFQLQISWIHFLSTSSHLKERCWRSFKVYSLYSAASDLPRGLSWPGIPLQPLPKAANGAEVLPCTPQ